MDRAKERILVVDDIEANREILERHLKRRGLSVGTAENGLRAMELLREEPFDLVMLDIMMPEMNGFQVLEELHNDKELRHIPVIVISSLDDEESAVKCIEMGATDYLTKPFEPTVLNARVTSSLVKKRWRDLEKEYLAQIEKEKKRADSLLEVILPVAIAQELKATNQVKPRRIEDAVILFADIVGFTQYCHHREPDVLLRDLQEMVGAFERIVDEYGLFEIKTIGDSFMASSDLLSPGEDTLKNAVDCGLKMVALAGTFTSGWKVRVGMHTGPVIAGVVGKRRFLFDVWGDTVNVASRVEQNGVPGFLTVSGEVWDGISSIFEAASSTVAPMKGKGDTQIIQIAPGDFSGVRGTRRSDS